MFFRNVGLIRILEIQLYASSGAMVEARECNVFRMHLVWCISFLSTIILKEHSSSMCITHQWDSINHQTGGNFINDYIGLGVPNQRLTNVVYRLKFCNL